MERVVYDRMAEYADRHWWYRARRDILARLIADRIPLPENPRILEIGCGTGPNLDMLRGFGRLDAVEIDARARAVASARLGRPVLDAPLPHLVGIENGAYDLICLLDVLEHVAEDRQALVSIAGKLRPGGRILIAVPAHPWMWSAHDRVNHHQRRYTKRTLRAVVGAARLRLHMLSYFNSLLFPLAVTSRLAERLFRKQDDSADTPPPAPLNRLFEAAFRLERYAIGRLPFPPGLSLVAIASAA
ncbi:MAG: class I SAM-dependent methyltransferase [Alphaproteobacteria bacterium]|nr:class I SAM-dependent methyltransferase [Alphaproteobacteria bacterium]MBV9371893.1 class I SAM-dependent methyltransferase [Alphaproteobacteria bacterium]MBV9902279.1 class I SAM-dependent methyltransferase [Alphaproteobacteria bacterium]